MEHREVNLKKESFNEGLASWQKDIIDDRLADYFKNPDMLNDFDKTLDDIECGFILKR